MKRLFLICCAGALLAGCGHGVDKDDKPAMAEQAGPAEFEVTNNAAGEAVVKLSADAQKRIELETAPLRAAEFQPAVTAYGTVLDAGPLVALQGDIAASQATLATSQRVAERAKTLFAQDQNVSQKTVEAAESDERADEIKYGNSRRSLEMDWGTNIAHMDDTSRQALADALAAHQTALAQVNLPMGDAIAEIPKEAEVSVAGRDGSYKAAIISQALKADPKTLGQGFLLRIDDASPALVPGMAVTARLKIPEPPIAGVAIPDTAIVRYEGKTWVYVAGADNGFTRRAVTVDSPLDARAGWFSTNGPALGEKVVVQAAEILLSEEQKGELQTD
jgi:hypothetical protein